MPQPRKSLPILASTLLLSLSIYVTILALADILDSKAETAITNWFESSVDPTLEEWNKTLDSLALAQVLDPMNSETPEKLGKLYQFSYTAIPRQSEEFIKVNEQALMLFNQAAKKRPAWAPHWGNIIQAKHDIWRFDEALDRAIINAAQTGPWFEYIQPIVMQAGARGWPELSESARQAVIKVMRSAMLVQPRQTISIFRASGLLEHVMPMIEEDQEFSKIYRNIQSERRKKAGQQLKEIGR